MIKLEDMELVASINVGPRDEYPIDEMLGLHKLLTELGVGYELSWWDESTETVRFVR